MFKSYLKWLLDQGLRHRGAVEQTTLTHRSQWGQNYVVAPTEIWLIVNSKHCSDVVGV